MKYYYIVDSENRLTFFTINKDSFIDSSDVLEIDLPEGTQVILGEHGILDGKLIFLGPKKEEVLKKLIVEKKTRLSNLVSYLSLTDYKVIKCYEAQLLNEEMPYDFRELITLRRYWREELNLLEEEINNTDEE